MNGPTFATPAVPSAAATRPQAAPPRPTLPPRPALAKPDGEGGALRMLTYLRLHWLTILFCGSFLGAGLAYAAWVLLPAKYESYAIFQVASNQNQVASQGDPTRGKTEFATYLKTTASLFKSEFVYIAALRNPEYRLPELPTIKAQKEPFKYFDEELLVDTKEGSEIIRLTLKGDRPEDIRRVVDAIKDAYMKEVVEREIQQKSDFRNQLQTAKAQLEDLLKRKASNGKPTSGLAGVPGGESPIGDIAAPVVLPAAATLATTDAEKKARFPILLQRVAKLESDIPTLGLQIGARIADAKNSEEAIKQLLSAAVGSEALEAAKKDEAYLLALGAAQRMRQTYERKKDSAANPNAPAIAEMLQQVTAAEEDAKKVLNEKAKAYEIVRRQPIFQKLNGELNMATRDVSLLNEQKKIAEKQLADAKRELTEMPPDPLKLDPKKSNTTTEMEELTLEELYRRATGQLIVADFELKGPARVRVLQSASTPVQKDAKKQIFGTIFAGLLGFALIGALAVAYETKVRKVSSLTELKTSNSTPVVGVIPWQPDSDTARDPIKRADVNEAIDKLRAYVVQSWLSRGATTVTVTSTLGDEGKAFTAFGLASSLAQAGYKTLLVDFDLRNPSLHPYAGVTNALGVCDLLRGEADFRKTIQVLPNGLHFLSAGKWSDEARQAAVGGRLENLLARLKEPFDCVVLHGHALLTVAESVEVARRSEVVLLCALYRETRIPMLRRAAERVATMEIPYSGVVYLGASPQESLC
jgi:Mrp family chromosome partitioning ATPase